MTIGTECPHCESVFQVAAELVGKSMRCPNPTCREVFTVGESAGLPYAPVPVPEPVAPTPVPSAGGTVAEYLPVFEAERAEPPVPVLDVEPVGVPVRPTPAAPVPKAAPLPPAPPTQRAPQVLDWSEAADTPPPADTAPRKPSRRDDLTPIRTRPRRSVWAPLVFVSLLLVLLGVVGGTVAFFVLGGIRSEEQDAAAADAAYQEGKYAEAKRKFEALAADYPNSSARDRYTFFAALSDTQSAITSVTVKEDPAPALRSLTGFIAAHGESSYAQPNTGYGADVVVAGQKLCTAVADHAAERVKKFQADRTKPKLLDEADGAIADGRNLIPTLEKFRDKSGLSFDDVRTRFDEAEAGVRRERERLAALDPWRDLADDPTDQRIDQFEKAMRAAGLEKDAEVTGLAAAAKSALRGLIEYGPEAAAAGPPPVETGKTLTAAPRVAGTPEVKSPAGKSDAVFGVARGVLYALDARTGEKLWAVRVSPDGRAADAPLRVSFPDGTDGVVVPSVRGEQAGLTARTALTGEAVWHLDLPAPAFGRPVRVGWRLFVPLADARGTLLQLDLATGDQLGKLELRQPIGGGVATLRGVNSGHGFLVVPGDARRVFVIEAGRPGEDGKRQPPRVVRVYGTQHPRDSLRGAPLVIDPDDATPPRRVILTQSDGPAEMRLRSFALPPVSELGNPSSDGDAPPEQLAEAAVGGWSWFPPVTDGERVAVCTDSGVFAAFGLNLPGQADKPLYQLPGRGTDVDPAAVSRCQVVWMGEDTFWVIVNGKLTRLGVATDPRGGLRIVPAPEGRTVGEPVAASQVRPADGLAVITTRVTDGGTVQVQAFDLDRGEERWRRQLGVRPVAPPVPLAGGGRLLIDECGGVYRTDGDALAVVEGCEPKPAVVSPAAVAVSPDGSRVWVAVQEPAKEGVRLTVRTLLAGKPDGDERAVGVPAEVAGNAVAIGDHLFLPLANGFFYRLGVKDAEAVQGPAWRGTRAKADAVCHLAATPDGQLLYGDGDVGVFRRRWATEKPEPEKASGQWGVAGPQSGPAVAVAAAGKEWVIVADPFGVAVFDPAKPSTDPVRRWQGAAEGELPVGAGSHVSAVGGKVAWAAGRKAVALAGPENDKPDWVYPLPAATGEVVGLTSLPDGLLVTTTSGVVFELTLTGEVRGETTPPSGGPMAVAPAGRVGDAEVLTPLADGTLSRLAVRKR